MRGMGLMGGMAFGMRLLVRSSLRRAQGRHFVGLALSIYIVFSA